MRNGCAAPLATTESHPSWRRVVALGDKSRWRELEKGFPFGRAASVEEIASFPGVRLSPPGEPTNFAHPFLDRTILGVLGDYVTMDTGTGAVHTAPAHGADDFNTGVKYKVKRESPPSQMLQAAK